MEHFRVGQLPSIYYLPDFIDAAQEQALINQIHSAPRTKWRELKGRRLQYWGGMVHEKGMIPESVPRWLEHLLKDIASKTNMYSAPLNHVLINEYLPGQGIMPHQDGPLYHPVVAILSLGSPTVMRFTPVRTSPPKPSATSTNPHPCTTLDLEPSDGPAGIARTTSAPQSACQSMRADPLSSNGPAGSAGNTSASHDTCHLISGEGPRDSSAGSSEDFRDSNTDTCQSISGRTGARDSPVDSRNVDSTSPAEKGGEVRNSARVEVEERRPREQPTCSVALMPRSLLVFKDEAYTEYLHGIDESMEHALDDTLVNPWVVKTQHCRTSDGEESSAPRSAGGSITRDETLSRDGTRLSLTCRRVLKVRKALIRL